MGLSFPKGCGRGGGDSSTKQEKKQAHNKEENKDRIIEKPQKTAEVAIIEETKEEATMRVEKARRKEMAECMPFFGGVGVVFDGFTGIITKVYKDYPGFEAGLQVDDQFVSPELKKIKGEVGTPVTITYLRKGTEHTVTITRGRICIKKVAE